VVLFELAILAIVVAVVVLALNVRR